MQLHTPARAGNVAWTCPIVAVAHSCVGTWWRSVHGSAQVPWDIAWQGSVARVEHLPRAEHADFYSSLGWTLNVTRADMVRAAYSPSARPFEASTCGVPIISDRWKSLGDLFEPDGKILLAGETEEAIAALRPPEACRILGAHVARPYFCTGQRLTVNVTSRRQGALTAAASSADQGAVLSGHPCAG